MVQNNAYLNRIKMLGCLFVACWLATVGMVQRDDKDIFDKMVLDPTLKTFVGLVVKADMVEAFKVEGPITVFAPNNAAFAKLPSSTLTAFKKDKALLRKTLMMHFIKGKLLVHDFKEGVIKSANDEFLPVALKLGSPVTVAGARIVTPDIDCSNGALHIVNSVLVPTPKPAKTP